MAGFRFRDGVRLKRRLVHMVRLSVMLEFGFGFKY